MMKTKLKTMMKTEIKNIMSLEKMSFLKITDPVKRDLIVEEYLKTKRNIQRAQLTRRLDEQNTLE